MFSVNQICVYHTLLEAHNIVINASSEQIREKCMKRQTVYPLRSNANNMLKVPEAPKKKATGFTYLASKLYNTLPNRIRESRTMDGYKKEIKTWIWTNIPSY